MNKDEYKTIDKSVNDIYVNICNSKTNKKIIKKIKSGVGGKIMDEKSLKHVNIKLGIDTFRKLKKYVESEGRTVSDYVRHLIKTALKNNKSA